MTRIPPLVTRHPSPAAAPTARAAIAAPASDHARLRETAQQLESVFTEQLFKAMRATVPQGEGSVDGGAGEEMFTGLMDQRLAADTPGGWHHGIGDALYRQLSRRLGTPAPAGAGAAAPGHPPSIPAAARPAAPTEDSR